MVQIRRRDFNLSLLAAAPAIVLQGRPSPSPLRVNGARLNLHLTELAQFGKTPEGGTNRVAYSDADLQARSYAMKLMREAKLDVTIDAAGNILGRRAGSDSTLKPLMIGSHIDSVPQGGSFDGQVGSMAAIEVAQTLAEKSVSLKHPLEVIIFQNEEGGTVGSTAIARGLTEKQLDQITNSKKTIRDGIRFLGGNPDRLANVVRRKGDIAAYLELHIEQGAYNIVPGKVITTLGLRDLDAAKVQLMYDKIQVEVRQIEAATGTKFEFKQVNSSKPAPTDLRIRGSIDATARQLGFTTKLLPSGAGHDAQEIAELCPVGMIFVPSRDGISHSPREFSTPDDITNGANVLLHSLLKLDGTNVN